MGVKCTQQMKSYWHYCHEPHLYLLFYFRMALNKSLNTICNLDGYLFCEIKTKWGKFSMLQDIHTRTEKYHAWEKADGRSNVRTQKRKAPHREMTNMQTEDNTSETDVPVGQGFRYPPQVFTDPRYAQWYPTQKKKKKKSR